MIRFVFKYFFLIFFSNILLAQPDFKLSKLPKGDSSVYSMECSYSGLLKREIKKKDGSGFKEIIDIDLNGNYSGYFRRYTQKWQLTLLAEYTDGKLNGEYKVYDTSGVLLSKGFRKDNIIVGVEIVYYTDGKIKLKNYYQDGKLDSKSTHWYENGVKKYVIAYKNGLKNGKSIYWFKNGKINKIESYIEDKKDGRFQLFNENGVLISDEYFDKGIQYGENKYYYNNGIIKSILNCSKDTLIPNLWQSYSKDGKLMIKSDIVGGLYNNTRLHGTYFSYYSNGIIQKEITYKKGLKNGVSIFYTNEGKIERKEYWENHVLLKTDD